MQGYLTLTQVWIRPNWTNAKGFVCVLCVVCCVCVLDTVAVVEYLTARRTIATRQDGRIDSNSQLN
jgi:hypothetical protein